MKLAVALLVGLALAGPASAASKAESSLPSLLILGTPHFDNPGLDMIKVKVVDVATPERQREIEAIVDRLAAFRPTRVAVEWPKSRQDKLDQRYADYRAGRYQLGRDERDQIGLRLAAKLGLERVDAVDWNEMPPGQDSDYDFPAWAEAHGKGEEWKARLAKVQAEQDVRAALMACTPVSAWLRYENAPATRAASQRPYYMIADYGDQDANPGAAWVGTWYARNLRILGNLTAIAPRAEDRVVAIFGAGHGYLLDQQARESGRFEVADTLRYLPKSPHDAWTRCRS